MFPSHSESPEKSRLGVLLLEHFATMDDPRDVRRIAHPLAKILLPVVCGTVADCDDYHHMAQSPHRPRNGQLGEQQDLWGIHAATAWEGPFPPSLTRPGCQLVQQPERAIKCQRRGYWSAPLWVDRLGDLN